MRLRIQVEGRPYDVDVDLFGRAAQPASRRRASDLKIPDTVLRPRPPQRLPEDSICRSPIAGRIVAVLVEPGRAVRRHEPVVIVEAMKMEVPIGPEVDGAVKAIHVGVGDPVAPRQALFELA
jgi:biotin carboxyl carrier protein